MLATEARPICQKVSKISLDAVSVTVKNAGNKEEPAMPLHRAFVIFYFLTMVFAIILRWIVEFSVAVAIVTMPVWASWIAYGLGYINA